jgi:transposase
MDDHNAFVGLDVHKESIAVAVAETGRGGEVRFLGEIRNEAAAVIKSARKIGRSYPSVLYAYEAGGCGYGLHRQLTGLGHDCVVVAPSKIPRVVNDRTKNDQRDAVSLARLLRADELSPVWVPDEGHEAMRDLVRARHAAAEDLRKVRQRIQAFLLRHERRVAAWRETSNVCVCPDEGAGRHERKVSEAGSESLANELAGLRGLDGKTLKERWRTLSGSEPPVRVSTSLLVRRGGGLNP